MTDEILFKYFKGETSPMEEQMIIDWVEETPANQAWYDRAHFIFIASILREPIPDKKIFLNTPSSVRRQFRRITRYAAGVAAVALLVLTTGYLVRIDTRKSLSNRVTTMEVPYGHRIRIALEDGSKVWLNAGSRIEYPVIFAQQSRRVRICGEAMFEVEHDADRPFVVETFASEIEVLGTVFNVTADEDRGKFSTALISGSVRITNKRDSDDVIVMKPHDAVDYVDGRMSLKRMDDPTAPLWIEGLIGLADTPFDELMAKFEKAFDTKIVIDRKTMPVTDITDGKIRISDGIDHALRVLQRGTKFTYERDAGNNTIYIR